MNDVHARTTRRAVSAMIEKAQELGVNGVAVAGLNTADPIFMSIEARCTNDLLVLDGQNLLAIALSKLAQCVRTGLESGQEAVGGENHWQGGVIDPELLSKARTQLVCAFTAPRSRILTLPMLASELAELLSKQTLWHVFSNVCFLTKD